MSATAPTTRVTFHRPDAGTVTIDTTRPELIPACVALVAHPDDERYQPLFGTTVRTPLFDVEVPVVAHHLADPEKGTGIAMICTFGDLTDVIWWRELEPADPRHHRTRRPRHRRRAGRRSPRLRATRRTPAGRQDRVHGAGRRWSRCCARAATSSASRVRSRIRSSSTRRATSRSRSSRTRQWYIRNGGRDELLRERLLQRGCRAALAPRAHEGALRQLGLRPQR